MNTKAVILGSFIGSVALITYRDFRNPSADWPLPAPPPYRYAGAGIAFGLLALVADTLNDRIAAVLAFGLLLGLGFQTASGQNFRGAGEEAGKLLGGGAGNVAKPPVTGTIPQ